MMLYACNVIYRKKKQNIFTLKSKRVDKKKNMKVKTESNHELEK